MQSISTWLDSLDLGKYTALFVENEVDLRAVRVLTDEDLRELGVPFGPRKRMLAAIADLARTEPEPSSGAGSSPRKARAVPAGERRQLTVLFCDMVGFTALASRVDPETLQTIVRAYEDACAACITRYDGYLFQRLGDGIVAFFGFPLAHEGEPERAVRAGLDILDTFSHLEVPEAGRLQVRIGIATGLVVVSTADRTAFGETMNLAARLQAIAEPGSMVVSGRVQRLAAGAFDYTDLGQQTLKGLGRRTGAYRILGPSAAASRFEAATQEGLTPLVGREDELDLLLERWRQSQLGEGQVVLLIGEAGIGKSRILSSLREGLEAEGVEPLRFQCSPYYVNSAFYPTIDHLERALDLQRGESVDARLDKLEAFMVGGLGRPIEDVRFVASILSIPSDERYGSLDLSPKRRKEETLRALVDLAAAAARDRPSLMLFEDVHWADPTSLEVLDLLVDRMRTVPLLLVLTGRPEHRLRWDGADHVTALDLARFTRDQSADLVSRVTNGKALPPDLLDQILARTDGVPLFVEELTRSILESGTLVDEGGEYRYAGRSAAVAIPATLRDLLAARLDRVMPAKEIAQIGAAIGREFSYELVAAVAPIGETELAGALSQLVGSGLAFQHGEIPEAVFTFKHALVQDAAYDSLLKSRRQELHGMIARALENRPPGAGDAQPELLAQHYTAAGLADPAIRHWKRAGAHAVERFALQEAISHLREGLELVPSVPAGSDRDLAELELRTLLGPAVVVARGWADPEVGSTLEPALSLVRSLDHQQSHLPVLHGLWVHTLVAGRLEASIGWAKEMLSPGQAAQNDDLEICGHRAAMTSYFWLGDLVSAREHGDRIREMYDSERHWHIAQLTNSDPLTADGIYRGQYLWMLGYPDQAVARTLANHEHACRRNHPFDHAFAYTLGAEVFDFIRQPDQLLERAAEGARVGREHGIPLMSDVLAEISKGIAWLRSGRAAAAAGQLRMAIERLTRTGQRIWAPYLNALLAEALGAGGDAPGGLAVIAEAQDDIAARSERPHFAEVLRIRAMLEAQTGHVAAAEATLRDAVEFARGQRAKSWELRAATSLARLLADRGDTQAARDVLAPVYDWFTEGFTTYDLQRARALLEELGAHRDDGPG